MSESCQPSRWLDPKKSHSKEQILCVILMMENPGNVWPKKPWHEPLWYRNIWYNDALPSSTICCYCQNSAIDGSEQEQNKKIPVVISDSLTDRFSNISTLSKGICFFSLFDWDASLYPSLFCIYLHQSNILGEVDYANILFSTLKLQVKQVSISKDYLSLLHNFYPMYPQEQ